MLYLIGLGLGDVKDISVRGLEAVRECDRVFLEAYTSILPHGPSKETLEEFYGRSVELADRTLVEQGAEEILSGAEKGKVDLLRSMDSSQRPLGLEVALLVVGDPFGATTHSDFVVRAKERGIPVQVLHNASVLNAVGATGLQLYRFGQTVSLVLWTESWRPDSYFDKVAVNLAQGFHTLCLLDIKVKEQSEENLVRGRQVFEPPRYMSAAEAADQLLQIAQQRRDKGETPPMGPSTLVVGVARLGWGDQRVVALPLGEMATADLGPPLHSLIVPGPLHEMEQEMLDSFAKE